jgi:hypothetical protein
LNFQVQDAGSTAQAGALFQCDLLVALFICLSLP